MYNFMFIFSFSKTSLFQFLLLLLKCEHKKENHCCSYVQTHHARVELESVRGVTMGLVTKVEFILQAKYSPIDFDYLGYFFLRYNEYKRRKEEFLPLKRETMDQRTQREKSV